MPLAPGSSTADTVESGSPSEPTHSYPRRVAIHLKWIDGNKLDGCRLWGLLLTPCAGVSNCTRASCVAARLDSDAQHTCSALGCHPMASRLEDAYWK